MFKNPFKVKPKVSKGEPWRTVPIPQVVKKDLSAAISVLQLILNEPEIFKLVCDRLEKARNELFEAEKAQSNGSTKPVK